MKKSMLMAVSVSILLTGCLVKKTEYDAELAAHDATKQELAKINKELALAASELKIKSVDLKNMEIDFSTLGASRKESMAALAVAEKSIADLKAESSASVKRAAKRADELADRLAVANKKLDQALAADVAKFQQLKDGVESELAELKAKNDKLREFMLAKYSGVDFAAVDANSGAEVLGEVDLPVIEVKKASSYVAMDAPVVAPVAEEVDAPVKSKRWSFWGKKADKNAESSVELGVFESALVDHDEKAAAKEAMRLMQGQAQGAAVTSMSKQLMGAAIATEDERMVKWVSVGVIKGADKGPSAAKAAVVECVSGTPYENAVVQMLNL